MWNNLRSNWFLYLLFLVIAVVFLIEIISKTDTASQQETTAEVPDSTWMAPSLYTDQATSGTERQMVIYGEDLITNTAKYFGPHGSIAAITNGMSCQNCHLDAGKRPWGNNFGAVYSTYPKFRERSGSVETIAKRVNDCFERSLNGSNIDSNSKEMKAFFAYFKWLGNDVPKNKKPYGSGLEKIAYINRAADPEKGKIIFSNKCVSCHGSNGEGQINPGGNSFSIPPLWGNRSFNDAAGMYRLSNFAGFIKSNMPFNVASHNNPQLTLEEAWDVAAFVNSQPRPHKDQSGDWRNISKKPVDYPFGPYTDGFTEQQHKYGPFPPIEEKRKTLK